MGSYVAVLGSGPRAAEWATRFLGAGRDVVADDRALPAQVAALWPMAERLGVFPGARIDRLRIDDATTAARGAQFVQMVGATGSDAAPVRPDVATGVLVADDTTACGHSPIHLLPLVDIAPGPDADRLIDWYRDLGMSPVRAGTLDADHRARLGPAVLALTGGDPDAVLSVMRALRPSAIGAGAALAAHEARRFGSAAPLRWTPDTVVEAPLCIYRTDVEPDWVDYNGHMTEAAYLTVGGWASDALFRFIGDDEAYREAGHSFYTVETHIHYLREAALHDPLTVTTQLLGVDAKRMHLLHQLHRGTAATDELIATIEQMLVHVHMPTGRSAPMPADIATAVAAVAAAHASLPVPRQVGTVMGLPAPRAAQPT